MEELHKYKNEDESIGRLLAFETRHGEFHCSIKWSSQSVSPEIGNMFFIESQDDPGCYWFVRVEGVSKTPLLNDTASEMILHTNGDLDLRLLRNELGERIVNVELLLQFRLEESVGGHEFKIDSDLNSVPTYGDHVKYKLKGLQGYEFLNSLIAGDLRSERRGEEKDNVIKITDQEKIRNSVPLESVIPNIELERKRTVIFGKTGMGKSVLAIKLIKDFFKGNDKGRRPVVIFDAQGEFATVKSDMEKKLSLFYHKDKELQEDILKNFCIFSGKSKSNDPTSPFYNHVGGVKFDLTKYGIMRAFESMYNYGGALETQWFNYLGMDAVKKLIEEYMNSDDDKGTASNKIISYFKKGGEGEYLGSVSAGSSIVRNLSILKERYHEVGNDIEQKLKTILKNKGIVVFDISGCPADEQGVMVESVVDMLLKDSREKYLEGDEEDFLSPLIVIDEAQLFFSGKMNDRSSVVRLFKEGRKFGMSSLFITQQPSSFDWKVLSQVENVFSFPLSSEVDFQCLGNINYSFNQNIKYQLRTNRKKYQAFALIESLPFSFPVDCKDSTYLDEDYSFTFKGPLLK